jgi:hypothetical protein
MPTSKDMTGSLQGEGMCPSRAAEAYKRQHEAAARLGVGALSLGHWDAYTDAVGSGWLGTTCQTAVPAF